MRKTVLILTLIALSGVITQPGFAQASPKATPIAKAPAPPAAAAPEQPEAAVPKARPLPYQGKIDRVNKPANTFTIKTKEGKEHVFHITEKTKIEKDDGPATIDDLKRDTHVRGSRIKLADYKWEAVKVTIGEKPEKAK
jgi:hypothetical protein